ncbi:UrvD/REP family ATP-dependent DNA helicase [Schaalia suimastitidis]|uniref:UrvD/REP family ATP-dependent DNA helicase n=1 Tax=Schaalia suimastitidis TaxID=121163 RepID=UPI00040ECE6F|nr:UrvD/REP family ATP-dependent DNA helicase [Schaalia suimastitidis]
MSETKVRLQIRSTVPYQLPRLGAQQQLVRERAQEGHCVVRGAPGSGRTTTALAIFADAIASGRSAIILVPDRLRADNLLARAQSLAPNELRPVRSLASFAYRVVSTWRVERTDPLGPVELVTGARMDQLLTDLIASDTGPWPAHLNADMRALPAFRTDMRNLFARAGETGIDAAELARLGAAHGRDEWVAAARIFQRWCDDKGFAVTTREVMQADLSRLQHEAAAILEGWDDAANAAGVTAQRPLPQVIVVDDLQDCTASTIELLRAAAACGSRIVAMSDPDVAVATYRGGEPQLDGRLAACLDVPILDLGDVYVGTPALRKLTQHMLGGIAQSGSVARRHVGVHTTASLETPIPDATLPVSDANDEQQHNESEQADDPAVLLNAAGKQALTPGTEHIRLHFAATSAQLGAAISRQLRAHYVHGDVSRWDQQVVIVKTNAQVEMMRRHLRRAGIPLAGGQRAFSFSQDPVSRTLLTLIVNGHVRGVMQHPAKDNAPVPGEVTQGADHDADKWRVTQVQAAHDLVDSQWADIDILDLSRLLRRLNIHKTRLGAVPLVGMEPCPLNATSSLEHVPHVTTEATPASADAAPLNTGAVTNHRPFDVLDLLENPALIDAHATKDLRRGLKRASAMWLTSATVGHMAPYEALWALWQKAEVAELWRHNAVEGGPQAAHYDDRLDLISALFRVADIWQQRHIDAKAIDFAQQILDEEVPLDTLATTGHRPPGVEVLTPAQAVGRHWPVVVIAGLQDGSWPDLRLRDRLLRADLLVDLTQGRALLNDDGRLIAGTHPHAARQAVYQDELRLYVAAITRSTRHLHLGAVSAEEQAPSPFLDAALALTNYPRTDDGDIDVQLVPPPLDLSGHIGTLRHMAASEEEPATADLALTLLALAAKEGIASAHPARWAGAGGVSSDQPIADPNAVTISPSSFDDVRLCPLRWFLGSHGGKVQESGAQNLGTLIHAIAEQYPHGTREELAAVFDQRVGELGYDMDTGVGKKQMQHARAVLEALATYIEGVPGRVDVEVPLNVTIDGVHLRGRIDRVEYVDDGVRVTDLKTGKGGNKNRPKDATENPQLALYQLGLSEMGYTVVGATLQYFGNEDVRSASQPALTDDRSAYWKAEIQRVADIMRGPTYEATPSSEVCRLCPHTAVCPATESGERTIQ